MNKKRVTLFLKNSGIVIIVPLIVYFFMEMACMLIADTHTKCRHHDFHLFHPVNLIRFVPIPSPG